MHLREANINADERSELTSDKFAVWLFSSSLSLFARVPFLLSLPPMRVRRLWRCLGSKEDDTRSFSPVPNTNSPSDFLIVADALAVLRAVDEDEGGDAIDACSMALAAGDAGASSRPPLISLLVAAATAAIETSVYQKEKIAIVIAYAGPSNLLVEDDDGGLF